MAIQDLEEPTLKQEDAPPEAPARRGRGRPVAMPAGRVLEEMRTIAQQGSGLFRVHRIRPDLYAAARRRFGSWAAAVAAAGIDYAEIVARARARSVETRRRARGRAR